MLAALSPAWCWGGAGGAQPPTPSPAPGAAPAPLPFLSPKPARSWHRFWVFSARFCSCLSPPPSVPAADSSGAARWPPSRSFIFNHLLPANTCPWAGCLGNSPPFKRAPGFPLFAAWQSSRGVEAALQARCLSVPAADLFPQPGSQRAVSALLSNALPRTPSSFPHEAVQEVFGLPSS